MAIRFEDMPEENQRFAIDVFARQQRGEISQSEAEAWARANEDDAQRRRNSGQTSGSFLTTPSGGGSSGGGGGGGNNDNGPEDCGIGQRWDPVKKQCVQDESMQNVPGGEIPVEEVPLDPLLEMQMQMLEQQREAQRQSAKAIVESMLADYGLEGLSKFVHDLIFKEDITSAEAIVARIRTDKGQAGEIYRTRFAGNAARRTAGFNALSEAQYIAMENTYRQIMRASGLPTGFYDGPDDFSALIGGDVSASELNSRINDGYMAVSQANPQVIAELKRLYPVGDGELAAYFLDPARATPILLRQARSAQIAAEATLQAGQSLTATTAEELAVAGVTQEQARQGFQSIASAQELFVALPGTTEEAITAEEQIGGVFGTSAAAQQRIRQRSRQRQAAFEAGGRFAGQGTTVTGLQ